MATEETPLLGSAELAEQAEHDLVYDRFSKSQKIVITVLVCYSGILPFFVAGTFMPVIPAIAKDLDTDGGAVSFAISLSILAASVGGLCAAKYSTFYGRRPVYLTTLPLCALGSIGTASAQTVYQLYATRVVQAIGAAPGWSVGAGVIGDIYKLEERGTAMGIYFSAILLGPALAPLTGGLAAHYFSWRIVQLAIGIPSMMSLVLMILFLPETSHPGRRSIDKWRQENPDCHSTKFFWLNPLGSLSLLRSPNLLAMSLASFGILLTEYVLLMPLAYTIAASYGITNQAIIGLLYAPIGIGAFIGAPLSGKLSDYIIVKYRAKRAGIWYPEDRLRATLVGAGIIVPLSILFSGLLTQFVPGKWGLIGNLVCLFLNGLGVDNVLSPVAAYTIDIMHSRSAESMAAVNSLRAFMMSLTITSIYPLINHVGVAATDGIFVLLALCSFGILAFTIRYGERMRAWVDMGYSTASTN